MKKLEKTIFLIEENPVVRNFVDVEKVLQTIFGKLKVKVISSDLEEDNYKLGPKTYYSTDEATTIYKILTPTDNYIIKVKGYDLQMVANYFRVEEIVFHDSNLVKDIKQSMKANGII